MLSDVALEEVETSNASSMSISESSIHSDDGLSVGLHVLVACIHHYQCIHHCGMS